jgi:hypothetical protein
MPLRFSGPVASTSLIPGKAFSVTAPKIVKTTFFISVMPQFSAARITMFESGFILSKSSSFALYY